MKHSPLPWIDNGNEIVSESNLRVGIAGAVTDEDNEFIVECCNNYERVLEENKRFKDAFRQIQHDIDGSECRDDLDGIKGYIDGVLDESNNIYKLTKGDKVIKKSDGQIFTFVRYSNIGFSNMYVEEISGYVYAPDFYVLDI